MCIERSIGALFLCAGAVDANGNCCGAIGTTTCNGQCCDGACTTGG
jgi:hypothetical protein